MIKSPHKKGDTFLLEVELLQDRDVVYELNSLTESYQYGAPFDSDGLLKVKAIHALVPNIKEHDGRLIKMIRKNIISAIEEFGAYQGGKE